MVLSSRPFWVDVWTGDWNIQHFHKEFDLTGRMWLVLYHLRLILFSSTTDITNIFVIIYEDIQRLLSGL